MSTTRGLITLAALVGLMSGASGCGSEPEAPGAPGPAATAGKRAPQPPVAELPLDPDRPDVVQFTGEPGFTVVEAEQLLPTLRDALFNSELDPSIRAWIARQVAALPLDASTELLIRAMDSPDVEVVRAAVGGLEGRSGPQVQEALESASAHPDPEVTRLAREILEGA